MTVSNTGNVLLLVKHGRATPAQCADCWEKIISDCNRITGRGEYNTFLKTYRAINSLLRDYNAVKANLICLQYAIDFEKIKFVRSKGYKIDTKNSKTYKESLDAGLRKCENILTRLSLKQNELELLQNEMKGGKVETFETLIASLSMALGYSVPEDITLSRYNEYVKLIQRKHAAAKAARERNGRT